MSQLPAKLSQDPIIQVVCQIRFESSQSNSFPEIIMSELGRFCQVKLPSHTKQRTPFSDMPAQLKTMQPEFKYEPSLLFKNTVGKDQYSVGSNVFGYDSADSYPGWDMFQTRIHEMIDILFEKFDDFSAVRLGLRYINNFTAAHGVSNLSELNVHTTVGEENLTDSININFRTTKSNDLTALVRIASPDFVDGPKKDSILALVDIDVSTPTGWRCINKDVAKEWFESAHVFEKEQFFRMFTAQMLRDLVEE